jgi:hypothetical protein
MSLPQEIVQGSFKLLDIGYTALMYFTLGLILAQMMDLFYGKINAAAEKSKSPSRKLSEVLGMIWLNGIVIYFMSNIASLVPFPLSGVYGYDHSKIRDFSNSTVFVWSFLYYQKHFHTKVKSLYSSTRPTKPRPALTPAQLVAIRSQINKQIAENRINDRATIKALYESAVSQALVRAVNEAKRAENKLTRYQTQPRQYQTQPRIQSRTQLTAVPNPVVTVYEHCEYQGKSLELGIGTHYHSFINSKGFNDTISSIKVPAGLKVVAFEHDQFQGRQWTFTTDNSCIVNVGANDTISSIIVSRA